MSEELPIKEEKAIRIVQDLINQTKENVKNNIENLSENRITNRILGYRALETLLDLYQKEKEKNEEYEKTILQDTSYSMITRLEMKLKYDIEQINKKLTSDEYINDYRVARLKGIRTKCKELLELLEERN